MPGYSGTWKQGPSFGEKLQSWWNNSNTKNMILPALQSAFPLLPGGSVTGMVNREVENLGQLAMGQQSASQAYGNSPLMQEVVQPVMEFGKLARGQSPIWGVDQETGEAHIAPEAIETAADVARLAPMSGAVSRADPNALGVFLGPRLQRRAPSPYGLPNQAQREAVAAQNAVAQPFNPSTLDPMTTKGAAAKINALDALYGGYFQGPNSIMREVPDTGLSVDLMPGATATPMGRQLQLTHPELPGLQKTLGLGIVEQRNMPAHMAAGYSKKHNLMFLKPGAGEMDIAHELQHAISRFEGTRGGTSPRLPWIRQHPDWQAGLEYYKQNPPDPRTMLPGESMPQFMENLADEEIYRRAWGEVEARLAQERVKKGEYGGHPVGDLDVWPNSIIWRYPEPK